LHKTATKHDHKGSNKLWTGSTSKAYRSQLQTVASKAQPTTTHLTYRNAPTYMPQKKQKAFVAAVFQFTKGCIQPSLCSAENGWVQPPLSPLLKQDRGGIK